MEFEVWVIFVSVSVLGFQPSERERKGGGGSEGGRGGRDSQTNRES